MSENKCPVCGKQYQRPVMLEKHMKQHDVPAEAALTEMLNQMAQTMKMMQEEIVELKKAKETPEESRAKLAALKITIAKKQAEKLAAIEAAPKVSIKGIGNDGEPEVVSMCGKRWVIPVGKIVKLPKPIAENLKTMRARRLMRDNVANYLNTRSFSDWTQAHDLGDFRDEMLDKMSEA